MITALTLLAGAVAAGWLAPASFSEWTCGAAIHWC